MPRKHDSSPRNLDRPSPQSHTPRCHTFSSVVTRFTNTRSANGIKRREACGAAAAPHSHNHNGQGRFARGSTPTQHKLAGERMHHARAHNKTASRQATPRTIARKGASSVEEFAVGRVRISVSKDARPSAVDVGLQTSEQLSTRYPLVNFASHGQFQ